MVFAITINGANDFSQSTGTFVPGSQISLGIIRNLAANTTIQLVNISNESVILAPQIAATGFTRPIVIFNVYRLF
ncbi:hypothetical protein OCB14_29555 [Bacillus cereus]|nr:hypothetical protein [Bacillus cereus]